MDWCRLTTDYYLDTAVLRAGEAAEVLFLRCIAYSGAQELRGRIPKHVLPMLTPTRTAARVKALLTEGLVVEEGDTLVLKSWERIQESLDTESERRRKDRDRKRAEREAIRAESVDVSVDSSTDSPQTVRTEEPRKEVEVEVEKTSSSARKRARPRTEPPDHMLISPSMAAWGRENCPLIRDPQAETARFLDHARANGKLFTDWSAAWRTWMGNAQKYAVRDGVPRTAPGEGNPATAWAREQG